MAVLGTTQSQPLEYAADGTIGLEAIEAAIKTDDPHFARTRLITPENTIGGKVLPDDYCAHVIEPARGKGLTLHLDGDRVFNAAATRVDNRSGELVRRQARHTCEGFDTVSISFSKGFGAPARSLLLGSP